MVNRDVIAAKLADLAARVARVRTHAKTSAHDLATDIDATDLVSFNLMLAVQVCADIGSHIVADQGWPVARTVSESFVRLAEHGVVPLNVAQAMARAAGFRNIVAHGYASTDIAVVHRASTVGLADIEQFATAVARWINTVPDA